MAISNPTNPTGVRSDEGAAARALSEVLELATQLRRDFELTLTTIDALLAEASEARNAISDGNVMAPELPVEQTTLPIELVEGLRDFAATEVAAGGDIGIALYQDDCEYAREWAAATSNAIAALNLLGWADEEPHEITLRTPQECELVRLLAGRRDQLIAEVA